MDAVKAFMERARMCSHYARMCSHYGCGGCPLNGKCGRMIGTLKDAKEAVEIVEKWSEEHPLKTNGMKVRELIPENQRATDFKEAEQDFIGLGLITSEDYVQILVRKSWWDAEYKEGDE